MTALKREPGVPDDHQSSVEDMLADPIVHALMAADGVRADDVRALMRWVAELRRTGNATPTPTRPPGAGSSSGLRHAAVDDAVDSDAFQGDG